MAKAADMRHAGNSRVAEDIHKGCGKVPAKELLKFN